MCLPALDTNPRLVEIESSLFEPPAIPYWHMVMKRHVMIAAGEVSLSSDMRRVSKFLMHRGREQIIGFFRPFAFHITIDIVIMNEEFECRTKELESLEDGDE